MPNQKALLKIAAAIVALALILRFRNQLVSLAAKVPGLKQIAGV